MFVCSGVKMIVEPLTQKMFPQFPISVSNEDIIVELQLPQVVRVVPSKVPVAVIKISVVLTDDCVVLSLINFVSNLTFRNSKSIDSPSLWPRVGNITYTIYMYITNYNMLYAKGSCSCCGCRCCFFKGFYQRYRSRYLCDDDVDYLYLFK